MNLHESEKIFRKFRKKFPKRFTKRSLAPILIKANVRHLYNIMLYFVWEVGSMISVNIRELSHNLSSYLKKVKNGERITILERNIPIADVIPHNQNIAQPGWKREIKRIKIAGEPLSETIVKNR